MVISPYCSGNVFTELRGLKTFRERLKKTNTRIELKSNISNPIVDVINVSSWPVSLYAFVYVRNYGDRAGFYFVNKK